MYWHRCYSSVLRQSVTCIVWNDSYHYLATWSDWQLTQHLCRTHLDPMSTGKMDYLCLHKQVSLVRLYLVICQLINNYSKLHFKCFKPELRHLAIVPHQYRFGRVELGPLHCASTVWCLWMTVKRRSLKPWIQVWDRLATKLKYSI